MTEPITSTEELIDILVKAITPKTDEIRFHKVLGPVTAERQIIDTVINTLVTHGISLHNTKRCTQKGLE